jgi:NAD(P)-dependent dehydrogenase (short-subunit alcohol dehydrogenase family)
MSTSLGKVALVTGAGGGIGLATAKAFAEEGASVVVADRDETLIGTAAEDLRAAGHEAVSVTCDVTDSAQVAAMIDLTVSTYGRLDAAFNNAGVKARLLTPSRPATRSSNASATSTSAACGTA